MKIISRSIKGDEPIYYQMVKLNYLDWKKNYRLWYMCRR